MPGATALRGKTERTRRACHCALAAAWLACLPHVAFAAHGQDESLVGMDIEKLLNVDVYTASRFPQARAEAPSALTVITADDIRLYGFRSLDEILRSVPGVHISSDRVYKYVGVRGIRRPQDFNSPVLLLIDGQRMNDGIYDTASIGNDFTVDVEMIERVEFVRGPGSSVYGSNALLGVVNVITRDPRQQRGSSLTVEGGDAGSRRVLARTTAALGANSTLLLAASHGNRDGGDVYIPAFDDPSTGNGVVRNLDGDHRNRFMATARSGPWRLQLAHSDRDKQLPLPVYEADLGSRRNRFTDTQGFANLSYESDPAALWQLQARVYNSYYRFYGDLDYSGVLNRDRAYARRWGTEVRSLYRGWHGHRLLLGAELADDYQQDQINFDENPYALYLDRRDDRHSRGLFVQDEWQLHPRLKLTSGLRYDYIQETGGEVSPRLALIANVADGHTVKLLHGRAFRAPSRYERNYSADGVSANPALEPERTYNWDLLWEAYPSPTLRLQVGLQHFDINDFIVEGLEPGSGNAQYMNSAGVHSTSLDVDLEKFWPGQVQSRLALSLQRAEEVDQGQRMLDSPAFVGKFYLAGPLPSTAARWGLEVQSLGDRISRSGRVESYALTNLTVSGLRLAAQLELSASVYNLFNQRYADPSSNDLVAQGINDVAQEGREFRIGLDWAF